MKGVVYHGPEDFKVEDVPDPGLLLEGDALLRVTRTAICGTDLHFWHGEPLPFTGFTLGHEFMGIVEDAGSGVQRFRKGDRVLSSCTIGCGTCGMCSRGQYGGCSETTRIAGPLTNVFGNPALPGGQALFLTDILPTGYMGADLAEVSPGDVVVVFGCGPVGVFAQRCAALFGAAAVVAVDLDDQRLERARARGCVTVNPESGNLLETVQGLTDGRGADAVIEAVGRSELVLSAVEVARPGARIAVMGVISDEPLELPYMQGMFAKSLTVRSGVVTPQTYIPRLLPLVEQGRLDPTEIITHRLPLDDAIDGYRTFASHSDNVLKVVLEP
jgi:alcohol dehydrogenase